MQIYNVTTNKINTNLSKKQIVFKGDKEAPSPSKKDDDKYVKITKTQNTINNIAWAGLGVWVLFDILKIISNKKNR